jgi:hypothetical protein
VDRDRSRLWMWRVPISVGLWILRGPNRIGLVVMWEAQIELGVNSN